VCNGCVCCKQNEVRLERRKGCVLSECTCINIHMRTHMYTLVQIHTHTHIHAHAHAHKHIHTHTRTHTHTHTHTHTYTYKGIHTYIYVCIVCLYIHKYLSVRVTIRVRTRTREHMTVYVCLCLFPGVCVCLLTRDTQLPATMPETRNWHTHLTFSSATHTPHAHSTFPLAPARKSTTNILYFSLALARCLSHAHTINTDPTDMPIKESISTN